MGSDARGRRYGDICIHIADSLCCTAETNTPLKSNYTPKKMLKKKKREASTRGADSLETRLRSWGRNGSCHPEAHLPFSGELPQGSFPLRFGHQEAQRQRGSWDLAVLRHLPTLALSAQFSIFVSSSTPFPPLVSSLFLESASISAG